MNIDDLVRLSDGAIRASRAAAAAIMDVYGRDFAVAEKADRSPVTVADERAEAIIVPMLQALTPDVPVVAEEAVAAGCVPDVRGRPFWLVDPLDGTKEFIRRNGEFTVNIALIGNGRPMLGVVLAPAIEQLFAGIVGRGAWLVDGEGRRDIRCRGVPAAGLTVVSSRSHGDADALDSLLRGWPVAAQVLAGSSLKLCRVAEGSADLYPRLGRTMEWDIAAGHAVLAAAGGDVVTLDGRPLRYGKPGFENPHFIARSADAAVLHRETTVP
jgi:3'(2'), 5'-bisphosphate nucleotidase